MKKTSYVLLSAALLLGGTTAAYLLTGSYIPSLDVGLSYLALCGVVVGACWLVGNYVRSSDVRESPVSADYRRHSGASTAEKKRGRPAAALQRRHVSRICRLTRALIEAANREEWSGGRATEGACGAPGAVADAQNELFEIMRRATGDGLNRDIVRGGLEQGVNDSVAISELAYRTVGAVQMQFAETEI